MKHDEKVKYFSYSDEDQDLWLLLTRTRYAIYRAREKELQRYRISPEQAGILFAVQALGKKATPSAISQVMLRQPHTISAIVDRMERKGLVKKLKDLDRKNMVRVTLTERGIKAYEKTTKRGPIRRIMDVLSTSEKSNVKKYLEKLMEKARQEIGMDRDLLPPSE